MPTFETLKAMANAAREADEVSEAIRLYTELVGIRPNWTEGWWYLGTLYYEKDQYTDGARAFQRFVTLEPKNGQGWAMLGLCKYQTKDYVTSLEHLGKGRELGLAGNEELARVVRYHQAVLLTLGRQFEAAQALLNGFAVEHRESDSVLDALGMAVLRISDPLEKLNSVQKEMIRQFGKAAFLAGERKASESRKLYDELQEHYRNRPNVAYAYGVSLLAEREPERAMTYFKEELKRNPNHVASMLQIALEAISSGKFEEALPYAKKASTVDPENFAAYYALGRIYLGLNDVPSAITMLVRASKVAPDVPGVYFVLARAYTRAKKPAEAARARAEFARLEALDKERRGEATGEDTKSNALEKSGPR